MFFNSPVQEAEKGEKQEKRTHTPFDPLPLLMEVKEHSLVVSFPSCFFFTEASCLVSYPVSYSGSRVPTVASFLLLTLTF